MTMTDDHPLLHVFADLKVALDNHTRELKASRDSLPQPVDAPLQASDKFPSSGLLALALGGPPLGSVWVVRRLAVAGDTPTTTVAGRADVFVMPTQPITADATAFISGATFNWVDQATTLPLTAGYSDRQVTLRHPQRLWVVISSGTASTFYVASGQATQYEEGLIRSEIQL